MKALKLATLAIAAFVSLTQGISTDIYDNVVGRKGLYYSAAAYCAYETLTYWECGIPCNQNPSLTNVYRITNSARNTFVFVGYDNDKNEVVVAFRGTNGADLQNWITNIKAEGTSYPGVPNAEVHLGFFQAFNDINELVRRTVTIHVNEHPTAKIFVTGHSLGGALAVFAAADIKNNLFKDPSVTLYTYGQPRVGNEAFSNFIFSILDGSYVRVTHYDDTVAHVPPRITGFKHAGNELWFLNKAMDDNKKEYPNGANQEENGNCSNSFWLKTGIWSHINYMGIEVSGICNRRQPGGTLKSGEEIYDTESYAEYAYIME